MATDSDSPKERIAEYISSRADTMFELGDPLGDEDDPLLDREPINTDE